MIVTNAKKPNFCGKMSSKHECSQWFRNTLVVRGKHPHFLNQVQNEKRKENQIYTVLQHIYSSSIKHL